MYTYYKAVKTEEHMLYPTEIAELAGLYSLSGKPATMLVSAILSEYISNIEGYEQYYYLIKGGKQNKVYPKNVYVPAIVNFLSKLINQYGEEMPLEIQKRVGDKNYNFKIKLEENNIK